ncbi:MAG: sigma factor [Candidatus Eisenbacteria bacterium]
MDARATHGPWMEHGREAALALAARRGELPAFFELLRAFQLPLWRVCFALTRHRGECELLVQETARRGLKNLKQLPDGEAVLPWLLRLARNLALAQARRRAGESRIAVAALRPDGTRWENGTRGVIDVSYEQRILAVYAGLSVDEQLVLALRLFERMSYAEIAGTLEQPLTATMHRIATLRERLELPRSAGEAAA